MEAWTRLATTLGELQIASFGQTLHLLDAGCRDARVCTLLELVEPFLEVMADLMERQTKESPPALSRSELVALRMQLQDTLSEAANSEIPNAIGHLDFNPGNILVNPNGCTFLDWAEACAGASIPHISISRRTSPSVLHNRMPLGNPLSAPRTSTPGVASSHPRRSPKH